MSETLLNEKRVTLLDLLDRILDKGVVLRGDITISVADVDLLYLGLKVLLGSVDTVDRMRGAAPGVSGFWCAQSCQVSSGRNPETRKVAGKP